MTALNESPHPTSIDPATQIGGVALTVADLERSLAYYANALGFQVQQRTDVDAVLGAAGTPLLFLHQQPGARPWPTDAVTGLYHFAILLPTRADLGRWLRHYLAQGLPMPGQGDHLVSEALYLRDPDEHGIEVYRDRPRSEWHWSNGQVRMAADPVDIRGLLADAEREGKPWTELPAGTRVGHIHLQVGEIAEADAFYHGVLGFDVVAHLPQALFVSAGGYHHHVGLNTWHSRRARQAPPEIASLRSYTIILPNAAARDAVVGRLQAAGYATQQIGDGITVRDPWENLIVLQVGG
ncbi:MAG TPA: VOC family protein [Chloroflexota bacterium]|jgi:catechol 2,3-dioxygenase|nr:VOC family protein [Chloroflexota bacterium]